MRPAPDPLDATAILRVASRLAGVAVEIDEEFRPSFDVLVKALATEAALTAAARRHVSAGLVQSAVVHASIRAAVRRDPSILEEPLPAPVFITGLPRTGTTLLHNLFAANPALRALRRWELREPVRPPDAGPDWDALRLQASERDVAALYARSPRLRDIHPMAADAPDECSLLFQNSFHTALFGLLYHVPSYMTWLVATDDAPSCRLYRLQLQFLARRGRGALVLKDPLHLWHLSPLLELFPDARVIRLHRPVEDVVVSFCGLFMALRFGTSDRMDPAAVGAECVRRIDIWLRRTASARQAACGRVVDVDFRELVSDPVGVTRRLHRALGRPFSDDAEAAATGWLQTHPSSGRPRPALSDFGLCPGDLDHLRALDQ